MDSKKLEARLSEWCHQLGFTLPDGTFPQSTLFSQLVSTPNTIHLWEKILNKVEPRDRIQKIRKQILVAKIKSDEKEERHQNALLNVPSSGIQKKVELWKKMKALEKRISEKRNEVDLLRDIIYKKAQIIQLESCKLAEIEKHHSDLEEKLLISNLLVDKHKCDVENFEEQIDKIKSYRNGNFINFVNTLDKHTSLETVKDRLEKVMAENLEKLTNEKDEENTNEIVEMITDKNSASKLWNLLLDGKEKNLKDYSATIDEYQTEEENCRNDENGDVISPNSLKEKFMLDITENSLETIFNKKFENFEKLKLKEITSNVEKFMFNKSVSSSSQVEISYIQPNETGDSLTGRREKMSKFMKVLSVYGLKKRNEFLKCEIEKLVKENKKNEHWSIEKEKFQDEVLRSSKILESMEEEVWELLRQQRSSVPDVIKSHNELMLFMKDLINDLNERKVLESMTEFVIEVKRGSENEIELVSEMCLDAFRRIHTPPGKEVYEWESLQHCLDHYGGELPEFFSEFLVSPYDKPEAIITILEVRKSLLSHVKNLISKVENDIRNSQNRFSEETGAPVSQEIIEKNHKEALHILLKAAAREGNLKTELELARNILKNWLKQPYRLMIPDTLTVNSMTLRQIEEKYWTVQNEITYCTKLDQSVAYK